MIPDEPCGLFLRTQDEIDAVRKEFDLTENRITEGVNSIMEWLQKQPHLVHLDINRTFVEMMIIIAKGSVERAKEKIDNFYKYQYILADVVQSRDEILNSPNKIWDIYTVVSLPKLHENRRISFLKFGENLESYKTEEILKRLFLLADLRLVYDYMAGDIWIIDLEHVTWKQIVQVLTQNPLLARKLIDFFMKSLNWRLHGIHILNVAASMVLIQRMIEYFKNLISSVILGRIVIHDNVESLYKYVPKECLPEDYGGCLPSFEKMAETTEIEYRKPKIKKYLMDCAKMVSNESLRPRNDTSEEYLSGSFRKLEVD